MRGDLHVVSTRLPNVAPRRRWLSWADDLVQARRRARMQRLEVAERLARDQRRARARGLYVPEVKYRVRHGEHVWHR